MMDDKKNPAKGKIVTVDGKRYKSIGNGNMEGFNPKKPSYKPKKMKPDTSYKSSGSKKGRPNKGSGW